MNFDQPAPKTATEAANLIRQALDAAFAQRRSLMLCYLDPLDTRPGEFTTRVVSLASARAIIAMVLDLLVVTQKIAIKADPEMAKRILAGMKAIGITEDGFSAQSFTLQPEKPSGPKLEPEARREPGA